MTGDKTDKTLNGDTFTVSSLYKKAADELAPDALNQAVLHQASTAKTNSGYLRMTWLKPLALTATIGISLAIGLQISDLNNANNPNIPAVPPVTERPAGELLDAASRETIERIQAAEEAAQTFQGSDPLPTTQSAQPHIEPDTGSRQGAGDDTCTAAQKETVGNWLQCIQSLERRGMTAAATREIESLMATYPTFERPE